MPAAASASAAPRLQRHTADVLADRERNMHVAGVAAAHIVHVGRQFESPVPPAIADCKLDLVTLMFNCHDFRDLGVDRAQMKRLFKFG